MDIMDDINNARNEEYVEEKFIVPVRMFYNTSTEVKELPIKANYAETAMLIALGFENKHIGCVVDEDYENYKRVKGIKSKGKVGYVEEMVLIK